MSVSFSGLPERGQPTGFYNVDALTQQVQPDDGIGKHMVVLQES